MVRPRSAEGFSLLELMLVLVIIGGLSALMVPGLSEFLADARASSASEDLVRLFRRTRARTQETGLAHWVQYDATASNNLGAIRVWEGMNNHCRQTLWTAVTTAYIPTTAATFGFAPVETLDMGSSSYNPPTGGSAPDAADTGRFVISLWVEQTAATPDDTAILQGSRTASWLANAGICFQPNGETYQGGPTGMTIHNTPFVFRIVRRRDGAARGVPRQVIVAPGGTARARL